MLIRELEERDYSHVCENCESAYLFRRSTSLKELTSRIFDAAGYTFAFILFSMLLLSGGLFSGVAIVGLLFLAYLLFWKRKECPVCKTGKLIPVSTPKGMKIMKKHGWKTL